MSYPNPSDPNQRWWHGWPPTVYFLAIIIAVAVGLWIVLTCAGVKP